MSQLNAIDYDLQIKWPQHNNVNEERNTKKNIFRD